MMGLTLIGKKEGTNDAITLDKKTSTLDKTSLICYDKTNTLDKKTCLLYNPGDDEHLERTFLVMNQSDSKNPLGSLISRCAFHKAEIVSAVVLLVSVFVIKQDDLLASAGVPALSWIWFLFLLAMMVSTRRRHGRLCACSPYDLVGESDPTHE
jgi:hypothetical protein